ncbi:MAG TPA: S8 family serine peptidase [Candidatus Thermoplasmatota archaeon]|nr:S8 family serine peptidase [Candidatus Thermoplasmatota archaeon]
MEARIALVLALLLLAPLAAPAGGGASMWQVVRYEGPVAPSERAFLVDLAGEPAEFVPPFGFLVQLTPHARAALLERSAVLGVEDVAPTSRVSREVGPDTRDVRLLAYPGSDISALAARLALEGMRVAPAGDLVLDGTLSAVPLSRLLAHEEIRWVEPLRREATLDNERASSIVQSGENEAWPLHARGVNGSSQIVAYCDTGLDTDAPLQNGAGRTLHEMFADPLPLIQNVPSPWHRKVALYYAPLDAGGLRGDLDDDDGHGTHVAGTLAGDAGVLGVRDGHDGVAFAARLAVCDATTTRGFQVLANYTGYWQPAYEIGARVHSNSWGVSSASGEYALVAHDHDAYAWEHRDFLILRSMGNGGTSGIFRPETMAKSVLAIGASRSDAANETVEPFSTRGPAGDGRVKPDLVAPGACVTSAALAGPTAYRCVSGTSQATPVAAGAATLVRDQFAKGFYPSGVATPADARDASSALVRAVLVASADDLGATPAEQGWGRPQLDDALAPGAGLTIHDEDAALSTGDQWTTTATASGGPLRVVVAWTDHAAAPGASPALVNDLDLEVEAPSGAVTLGNAALGAPDRANVVERVLLDATETGEYTIRVRGWSVPMGPQPFALVVVGSA